MFVSQVAKMTYDDAGEQEALAQQAIAQANPGHLSQRSHRSETSRTTSHAGSSAVPTQRPQGAILSKTGEFVRYDPAAYRQGTVQKSSA